MEYQDLSREDLLVRVAEMYYIDRLTQQQIADRVLLSRSNVARLLKICIDTGVVEFKIKKLSSMGLNVQNKLASRFSMEKVIVVPSAGTSEQIKSQVGEAAAEYLESILRDGAAIGLTWGSTVYQVVKHYNPSRKVKADVIQLVGGMESRTAESDGQDIVKRMQAQFDGSCYVLQAPMIVKNNQFKQLLMEELEIKRHFERIQKTEIAIIGLGSNRASSSAIYKSGHINKTEADDMIKNGAIGDICGTQINVNGDVCNTVLSGRVIGIELQDLLRIPVRIGVASGLEKANAILGALRGKYCNVLVVDEATGNRILDIS